MENEITHIETEVTEVGAQVEGNVDVPVNNSNDAPSELIGDDVSSVDNNEGKDVVQEFISPELLKSVSQEYSEKLKSSGFKSVDDLAKAYVNAQKLIGKRVSEMTPEDLKEFNVRAGAPESKDGYKFESKNISEEDANKYRDVMFEMGMPKEMAEKFIAWQDKETQSRMQIEEQEIINESKSNVESLKKEFGNSFDERIKIANKAVTELGGAELRQLIKDAGLGANPTLIKALVKAGSFLSEGEMPAPTARPAGLTPAEIDAKINDLRNDPEYQKAVYFGGGLDKEAALAKMSSLLKLKTGS